MSDDQDIINAALKAQRNRRKPISEQIKLPSPQVLIEPVKGVLPLQNLKEFGQLASFFLHQATPVIVTALVAVRNCYE